MKDTDFIELLNLYLDHEIGEEGATRLEAEVLKDPDRRRLYRQYCRMHKACTLLSLEVAPARPGEKIVEVPQRSRSWVPLYVASSLAAAAALVFAIAYRVQRPANPAAAGSPPALSQRAAVASVAAAPAAREELTPVFGIRDFSARAPGAGPLYPGAELAWLSGVEAPPLPPLPPPPALAAESAVAPNAGAFTPRQPEQAPSDLTAFQFQK